MRSGLCVRDSSVNSSPLMMSPRYDGSATPSMTSSGSDRGLANCPAMRPTLMIGMDPPNDMTKAICRMTRKVSRMWLTLNSLNASAQSPPMSKKP